MPPDKPIVDGEPSWYGVEHPIPWQIGYPLAASPIMYVLLVPSVISLILRKLLKSNRPDSTVVGGGPYPADKQSVVDALADSVRILPNVEPTGKPDASKKGSGRSSAPDRKGRERC